MHKKIAVGVIFGGWLFGFVSSSAHGYISGAVTAGPGKTDLGVGVSFERGRLGARNLPESQQTQTSSITSYDVKVGHNFGSVAGLQDLTARLTYRYFQSAEEAIGTTLIYGSDIGSVTGFELSANFIHDADRAVGAFARFSIPTGVAAEKFAQPKIDTAAFGLQGGFAISDTFGFENLWYYGSGWTQGGVRRQNASLVGSSQLAAKFPHLLLRGLTFKFGPFFESDLTERDEFQYGTTGLRGFRVGVASVLVVGLSSNWGLELGYVQKLSGAYFRATKDVFLSVNSVW